jgi:NAD-dependent deacetylase
MTLDELLERARRVVAFTGAGVSTESGIPDFRSPSGLWRRAELEFDRYVSDPEARADTWAMRRELFNGTWRPNRAHLALARLELTGRALGVVTQNIDGLHQDAGSRRVVELHGTAREVMCIGHEPQDGAPNGCGWRAPSAWAFEQIDAGVEDPPCPSCGGLVKSATVSFGQRLFPGVAEAAQAMVVKADLLVTIGSSLVVHPAAGLPLVALASGAKLVIVNDEETPLDDYATLVIRGKAGEVLAPAVDRLLG